MIEWVIEIALSCKFFDDIVVSTDDIEIANISINAGARVPFIRPESISDDYTTTVEVISHAIHSLGEVGVLFGNVCCVYPTAPFLDAEDLKEGLKILESEKCDYVFPTTEFPYPIQRALKIYDKNRLQMLSPENYRMRSQDLESLYHDAGQFYWGSTDAWIQKRPIFSEESRAMILPSYRVWDIDTPDDWRRAELMFQSFQDDRT